MIQAIGLMMAAYIITRMVSLASRTGDRAENGLVKVLAVLTILFTLLMVMVLISSGVSDSPRP